MTEMCKSVQECAKEENGNNDSFSSKNALFKYDFVVNNYTNDEVCQVKETIAKICVKGGFGFEVGEKGTPHLQGYIHLKKKQRITGLIKLPGFQRASMRACRNEPALITYIQKQGQAWTYGFPKPLKLINPDKEWQQEILKIMETEPDDRTIHWYWSCAGGMGKSQFAKYCVAKHAVTFFEEGEKKDIMFTAMEAKEERLNTFIVDVPRDNGNKVSYKALKSLKNGMIYSAKYESGYRLFNSPHIFVFANMPPMEERLSEDRWKITQIDPENDLGEFLEKQREKSLELKRKRGF
jgi:hypothetical protein